MITLDKVQTASRDNNLNIIRLLAAISVTFGHSFAMIAGDSYQLWGWVNSGSFGGLAVAIFFGLSGFLITQSWMREPKVWPYFKARWLRIFPGLFFACFVTTIIVSQFVKGQGLSAFLDIKNWRYTFGAFFFDYGYFDHVFAKNPIDGTNGSLWTLSIEFRMYLFVLLLGITTLLKRRWWVVAFFALLLTLALADSPLFYRYASKILFSITSFYGSILALPLCFCFGILVYLFRERFVISIPLAVGILIASLIQDHWVFKSLAFVYAAFTFGYHPRVYIPQLNFRNDLSYGIYCNSWPIQSILIYHGLVKGPYELFFSAMALVIPVAYISWRFVEKPALRLKNQAFPLFNRRNIP